VTGATGRPMALTRRDLLIGAGLMLAAAQRAAAQGDDSAWLAQMFDPAAFGVRELRAIQAALVWSGDYNALLDGAWGRGSAAALAAYVRREAGRDAALNRDLRPLLAAFEAERRAGGWLTLHVAALDLSLSVPVLRAGPVPGGDGAAGALDWAAPDGALSVRTRLLDRAAMSQAHDAAEAAHAGPGQGYRARREGRWVTGAVTDAGGHLYLRSDAHGAGFATVRAEGAAAQELRVALIASSIQRGVAPEFGPAPGDRLSRILAAP